MLDFIHRQLRRRSLQAISAAIGCAGAAAIVLLLFSHTPQPWRAATHATLTAAGTQPEQAELPAVLGTSDTARYRSIFALQQTASWQQADILANDVGDKLLMGHVLAQRYLSKDYKPSFAELRAWLQAYGDHPQVADIYKLAASHHTAADPRLPELDRKSPLSGYGDDNGLSGVEQDPRWIAGLEAWRQGDMATAAEQFTAMANAQTGLSPWQSSASAFWAWRALNKQGNKAEAARYLARAADYPRTFYGVLARKVRGETLGVDAQSLPALNAQDVQSLYENPSVKRAVALMQVDEAGLAENELRAAFPLLDKENRTRLLALSHELGLPAAQMSMASALKTTGLGVDAALYPTPEWMPAAGFAVDPSLVFAFARQESGFRAAAHSRDGGMGLMQLMPQTARSMRHLASMEVASGDIFDPSANLALGQSYLGYLLQSPQVKDNLIYLAAAYNAGPAKVAEWQHDIRHGDDPLLFLESIPFSLTRNYVAQVLTSYWVYREIAGRRNESAIALAHGNWPRYDGDDAIRTADAADGRG